MNIRQVVADSIQSIQNAHDRRLCEVIRTLSAEAGEVEAQLMHLRRGWALRLRWLRRRRVPGP